ncbi:hypothetical protein BMS3Bbin04_01862 [bacterium BMS3Bbin04]|nr:hypothetical protein BMS3Bbin04_01862 [bacterium BMS3Bbin04]
MIRRGKVLARLTFAFRFDPVFPILDVRGNIVKELMNTKLFTESSIGPHGIIIKAKTDDGEVTTSIEVGSISGTIAKIDMTINDYQILYNTIDMIIKDLEITKFNYIGYRQFRIVAAEESLRLVYNTITTSTCLRDNEAPFDDVGIIYQGKIDDYNYRIHYGPFGNDNEHDIKALDHDMFREVDNGFIYDCDISQQDKTIRSFNMLSRIEAANKRTEKIIKAVEASYEK